MATNILLAVAHKISRPRLGCFATAKHASGSHTYEKISVQEILFVVCACLESELLGNPRFSQSFLHGKLPFPDPFPGSSPGRQKRLSAFFLCACLDSNQGPQRYMGKKTPCACLDSNQGPQRYKLCALTN